MVCRYFIGVAPVFVDGGKAAAAVYHQPAGAQPSPSFSPPGFGWIVWGRWFAVIQTRDSMKLRRFRSVLALILPKEETIN
jgi:hypothetical protein